MKSRSRKLRRLVRVTELIYRQQSAELAGLNHHHAGIAEAVAVAESYLDRDAPGYDFMSELAIARAGRLRTELKELEAALNKQRELTSAALAGRKGAESRYAEHEKGVARTAESEALDEAVSNNASGARFSLEQD